MAKFPIFCKTVVIIMNCASVTNTEKNFWSPWPLRIWAKSASVTCNLLQLLAKPLIDLWCNYDNIWMLMMIGDGYFFSRNLSIKWSRLFPCFTKYYNINLFNICYIHLFLQFYLETVMIAVSEKHSEHISRNFSWLLLTFLWYWSYLMT